MGKMRVLVVGSGGREHALAEALAKSPLVEKVIVAPGNSGTEDYNVPVAADDIDGLTALAKREKVDLVVPGPELPLTLGLADALAEAGVACFGPDAFAARLEGSKVFAKEVMNSCNVPTASHRAFTNLDEACAFIDKTVLPVVIKADGLAAGKGVVVAESQDEALEAARSLMEINGSIIIEEKLSGEEVSLICICDGNDCVPLQSAQDHKRVYDGDKGPNTGGMGAYSPAPVLPANRLEKMADLTVRPVLAEMRRRGHPFVGALYAGLMLTGSGPKVLEYNVRFGDPECQVILPRIESDLAHLLLNAAKGKLPDEKPVFSDKTAVGVVLTAANYPLDYPKGLPISGIEEVNDVNVHLYHAGAKKTPDGLVSSGGRVLCVTALGETLEEARDAAYEELGKIRMPLAHYRKDIASRGLEHLSLEKKG